MSYQIRHYLTQAGHDVVGEWLKKLRDPKARHVVNQRVSRLGNGNFGDHRYCRDGVWELRINVGPGYRVYYALAGKDIVLLLVGGDKSTQSGDIVRACENWKDWRRRKQK